MNGTKTMKMVDRVEALEKQLENMAMVQQIVNSALKKVMTDSAKQDEELRTALSMLNEMQYRTLAIINVADLDRCALDREANAMRALDFEDMSNADDKDNGFVDTDVIAEDSVVTITTTAKDPKESIFRSKFLIEGIKDVELKTKLIGAKVNDSFEAKIDGVDHTITILAVKKVAPVAAVASDEQPEQPEVQKE